MLPDAGLIDCRVALFLARGLSRVAVGPKVIEEPGTGEIVFFTPQELATLLMSTADMGGSTFVAGYRFLHAYGSQVGPYTKSR